MLTTKRQFKHTIIAIVSLIFFASSATAKESNNIPYMDDAKVFAEFNDELPSVINYYTLYSEQEIVSFYQELYGEVEHSEMKRGRLTLVFSFDDNQLRVIISAEGNRRQVDAILQ